MKGTFVIIFCLAISVIAMVVALATFGAMLVLLGGKEDRFVTWRQMHKLVERLARVEKGNVALYRYVEAVDEATGADGHKVLAGPMPRNHSQA